MKNGNFPGRSINLKTLSFSRTARIPGLLSSKTYGEGTCIADLNGDGKPDIVKGGWWLENPKDPLHDPWPEHWFYKGWPDRAGVAVADLNRDGRLDIALAAAESRGRLSWFEGPADPIRGSWKEHVINEMWISCTLPQRRQARRGVCGDAGVRRE